MTTNEAKNRATDLAESMGWFLGQIELDGKKKPILHRPGKPAQTFSTWLIALTEIMRLRELLPRGEMRQPPMAAMRPATAADAHLPLAEIVPAPAVRPVGRAVPIPVARRIG